MPSVSQPKLAGSVIMRSLSEMNVILPLVRWRLLLRFAELEGATDGGATKAA
jgi:hypothetical protein